MSTGRDGRRGAGSAEAERLRDDIDRGRTGDKVAWPDPAAAPLGTDDEAAGTPIDGPALSRARQRELAFAAVAPRHRLGPVSILLGVIVLIAVLAGLAPWTLR